MEVRDPEPAGSTARRAGAVIVWASAALLGAVGCWILHAKWMDFDPFLLDFAKTTRFYECLIQGVDYEYPPAMYAFFYAGYNSLLVPVYALVRSVWLVFATHLAGFVLTVPLVYAVARQRLPGVALPLSVTAAYVLSPTVDLMLVAYLRQESLWMVAFLLTVYWIGAGKTRAAVAAATVGCFLRIDGIPVFFLLGVLHFLRGRRALGKQLMARSAIVMALLLCAIGVYAATSGVYPNLNVAHLEDGSGTGGASLLGLIWGKATSAGSYAHLAIVFQFLLLPLLAPLELLPALVSVGYVIISSESFRSIPLVAGSLAPGGVLVPFLHPNDTFLVPILLVATAAGLGGLYRRLNACLRWTDRTAGAIRGAAAVCLTAGFFAVHWFFTPPALGPVPLTPGFDAAYYEQTPHSRLAWDVLREVPADEPGLVQSCFAERSWWLVRAREIYPTTEITPETRYVLMDLSAFSTNMPKPDLVQMARNYLARDDFRVERFEDGILLLVRGPADDENDRALRELDENRDAYDANPTPWERLLSERK